MYPTNESDQKVPGKTLEQARISRCLTNKKARVLPDRKHTLHEHCSQGQEKVGFTWI